MAQTFIQNSEQYLTHIDAEIEQLQQLRNQVVDVIEEDKAVAAPQNARRGMSVEGRKRVAEAQKARWAKQKKEAKKAAKSVVIKRAKK